MRLSYNAAALACCTLLLACHTGGALAGRGPLKTPTAREGDCFNNMTAEIKKADDAAQGYGIIFYGDSITETLRGTDKCRPCESRRRSGCDGVPQLLKQNYGKYRPGVMGMSMDESAHLLWRLMNGQIPKKNFPKVAVILIGTNDMTNSAWSQKDKSKKEKALAKEVPGIVGRIQQAVQLLRKGMPTTTVLILGELPRGTGTGKGLFNADNDFSWPSHYAAAVASINSKLKAFAAKDPKVAFLDCGSVFLTRNKRAIDAKLMGDAIHPTKAGWGRLMKCLNPTITTLMK